MTLSRLSRRERQIMEIVYERGQASAAEVRAALPDPPSYSSVRALLRILEDKGHLRHRDTKGKYIYLPIQHRAKAGRLALDRVVQAFYQGSLEKVVAALLDGAASPLTSEQIERLESLIRRNREEGR